ncbi:MAG: T9SS type A sorting domain-containing protein [Ignavibacteriae bacterium]|nr:T9SS type A sorting domain-containing protein [Ignavibacteriota bacterium]
MNRLIVLTVLAATLAHAQERLLVNPNNEVIPLRKGESAIEVLKDYKINRSVESVCSDKFTFGYTPDNYTPNTNFGARHKDVLGMWFVAPASGTIDTIFWMSFEVGAQDSQISVRIHQSNIFPGHGPGYPPYPAPCQPWGYYVNVNDSDQFITPFRDEATDTQWISTLPGDVPSFDPLGEELWGAGGYQVISHANSVNALALDVLGYKPEVKQGNPFFITMRVASPNRHVDDERTAWATYGYDAANTADPNYPSRNWKFYEHDKGPSNCAGFPVDNIPKGWVARGGFGGDTLSVAVFNYWYVMTVETGVPPRFACAGDTTLRFVLDDSLDICIDLESCPDTNITSIWFVYSIGSAPPDSVLMKLQSDSTQPTYCVIVPPISDSTLLCSYLSIHNKDSSVVKTALCCSIIRVIVGVDDDRSTPRTYALYQNYPNPFNPRTDIKYQIPENSYVILKVFNVLGQEVVTLVNEKKAPGDYTVTWDASNQPSGVYFYRVQTEKFIAVKKMLLIQ